MVWGFEEFQINAVEKWFVLILQHKNTEYEIISVLL